MTFSKIERSGYATDGGSIFLEFSCSDGTRHALELVQEAIPIKGWFVKKRNGDVFLDGQNVVKDKATLRELANSIATFLAADTRVAGKRELPKNTTVLGDDLKELMTSDEVGSERLLLTWAQQRLEKKSRQ
jgi:hypothetical protein